MGTRQLNRLTARTVATKQKPGLYCDGGGLYLQVSPSGSKAWIFRYRSAATGRPRDMGLGPVHAVGLPEARTKAATQRSFVLSGLDPIVAREEENQKRAIEAAKSVTFAQCAAAFIESHAPGWRNEKHAQQWTNTIKTYCEPVIGSLPVQEVDIGLVLKILEPIWATKPETASRLRGRIENVLDWAKARGYRSGENPARWKGHLNQLLPSLAKKDRVTHHKAMPFTEVSGFVSKLRELASVSASCLEFTILTAARTNETIYASPDEFDLDAATWIVPASRMKAKKEHRVPLSLRAVEIVREMLDRKGDYVFPGAKSKKPMSNMAMLNLLERMGVAVTVHGFRSSLRDWAAERTAFSHEVCEMALAHTIPNAAEAAYRRGDLFEKRRKLMDSWAEFVNTLAVDGSVIPLRAAA
ncbi:MAG: integrase [Betaproteobacteria bacterium RIFCSPLOWO2_12_FULL_62_58]|nr:MAG: integrase [Betaproteobacteria bacterium RIFCSPLOWO2_12_FULL_62_58]HLE64358.1 integrase arm-type DNA-binding domain-containing protein [Pyrinomonadaceae bacterium]